MTECLTKKARGFEPRSLGSESRVLTVTPRDQLIEAWKLATRARSIARLTACTLRHFTGSVEGGGGRREGGGGEGGGEEGRGEKGGGGGEGGGEGGGREGGVGTQRYVRRVLLLAEGCIKCHIPGRSSDLARPCFARVISQLPLEVIATAPSLR